MRAYIIVSLCHPAFYNNATNAFAFVRRGVAVRLIVIRRDHACYLSVSLVLSLLIEPHKL